MKIFEIFKTTFTATKQAVRFRIQQEEESNAFNDRLPLSRPERILIGVSTLYPPVLKSWIIATSSYNFGSSILDQVFPRFENLQEFHSTESELDLNDHPVQVLGGNEVDDLKKEGINNGLNGNWIDIGFENRAIKRGIDLEWHFRSTVHQESSSKRKNPRLILPQG